MKRLMHPRNKYIDKIGKVIFCRTNKEVIELYGELSIVKIKEQRLRLLGLQDLQVKIWTSKADC